MRARAVAEVLPFRTNSYVVDELIDWEAAPEDPIYRLVFPQPDMLPRADVDRIGPLLGSGAPSAQLRAAVHEVRMRLNPHPGGQLVFNTPLVDGLPVEGMQHKYPETVLFFPARGRPATRTARTASDGRSSSASPTCGWRAATPQRCTRT